ncbi:MAG: dienelactone hydrolase family protein [Chloroflexi bacterium]|nr:dienelactone hydrolase family protein [Chloroflexota bacterium]
MTYEGMMAETVRIAGHQGDPIDAYFSRPLGSGPYPGVVVIHHAPGWDEGVKEITRKLTHHGYAAICPNLHHRESLQNPGAGPDDAAAAVRTAGGVPDDRCLGDIQSAVDYLRALPYGSGKIGVIGYCSGGRQTYMVACKVQGLAAAVDCYGGGVVMTPEQLTPNMPVAPLDMTRDLGCPLLGLFGADDPRPSPADTETTERELRRLGKTYEFHTYPNAGHGFFHPERPGYRQHAAEDGWQRIFAWYHRYLA